jgi:uncharacterized UPF0160 family protein
LITKPERKDSQIMSDSKIPRSVGTHDGTFHADEVTACALLLLYDLIDRDKICRTRDKNKLDISDFVCDVGGFYEPEKRLFDHHQADYQGGLSSAGMILKYLREEEIITQKEYDFFNNTLITGIDAIDNGRVSPVKGFCTFSNVISNFVPVEYTCTPSMQDEAFFEALDFVVVYLTRLKSRFHYHQKCEEIVSEVMEKYKNEECLIFDESLAWLESFFELDGEHHKALFVVMPSGDHWKLRGIPPNFDDRMSVRLPLPQEWAGLLEGDLKEKSKIAGAIFCHKGRFISVWETREDALRALEYTLAQAKNINLETT